MKNIEDNIWVIGDVHGCYKTLLTLINKIKERTPEPQIYFVGDLIDKGPDSKKVLKYIKKHYPNNVVLGNHEAFMIKYSYENNLLIKNDFLTSNWYTKWGGKETLLSYSKTNKKNLNIEDIKEIFMSKIYNKHYQWLKTLPVFISIELENEKKLLISHSNLLNVYKTKAKDIESKYNQFDLNEIIYGRKRYLGENEENIKDIINIHGHTQLKEPYISDNLVNIDTGCVYFNTKKYRFLSAVSYPNLEIINTVCEDKIEYI